MKKFLLSLFLLGSMLIPNVVSAERKIIEADGEYHLGDYENVSVGRERAKEDALRNASMKGGTFIRSEMKSVDNTLTEDQVTLVTSNIVELHDLKTRNDTTSDEESIIIRCHVIVLVDSDSFEKILRNPELLQQILQNTKQLEDDRIRLSQEVKYWKDLYESATTDSEREKAVQGIENNENVFTATQYFDRGNKFGYAGKYSEAVDEYSKAIELNPIYFDAYTNRGFTYLKLSRYDEAIQDCNRAIELAPDSCFAYNNRGSAYFELKKYSEAIHDFNSAIVINPNFANAYFNLGFVYYNLKKYDDATRDFSKALNEDPNYIDAYLARGSLYCDLHEYEKAAADFNKVIEINPNNADAYLNRGIIHNRFERYDDAIRNLNKAVGVNDNTSHILMFSIGCTIVGTLQFVKCLFIPCAVSP